LDVHRPEYSIRDNGQAMFFNLIREWLQAPFVNYRLFHNFTRQDFFSQFTASIGGVLWLFLTPIVHLIIYSFVFSYIFKMRAPPEFGEINFVIFLMIGYLPWFAFADAFGRAPNLVIEKAPLITKVVFPVQIIPITGTVIPYLTHVIGFTIFLVYLTFKGYLSVSWILLPFIFGLQFLFTLGLVAVISALCVFLRDLQQMIALMLTIWFFLTPIIYPISLIQSESVQRLFLLNPMHSFISAYREIILLGTVSPVHLMIIVPISIISYVSGGWLFMRIKHAFGDVL
jgi:lipopolysaccharide transport system permease protein